LAGKRVLEENGRAVNQKNHNELRGFSTGLLARALQRQSKNVPDTFNSPFVYHEEHELARNSDRGPDC
jgi:hypothetical protein